MPARTHNDTRTHVHTHKDKGLTEHISCQHAEEYRESARPREVGIHCKKASQQLVLGRKVVPEPASDRHDLMQHGPLHEPLGQLSIVCIHSTVEFVCIHVLLALAVLLRVFLQQAICRLFGLLTVFLPAPVAERPVSEEEDREGHHDRDIVGTEILECRGRVGGIRHAHLGESVACHTPEVCKVVAVALQLA